MLHYRLEAYATLASRKRVRREDDLVAGRIGNFCTQTVLTVPVRSSSS